MKPISPYIIPPLLSLLTAFPLAAVALFRGKKKYENILFALVCLSWNLTSIAFTCQYLVTDDAKMLRIERYIHTLYVFMPAVSLLFFQVVTEQKNRFVTFFFFLAGLAISATVHTDYYFYGLITYNWGRIAKGGVAFKIYAVYGVAATLYIIYLFINKLRLEKNPVIRIKVKYLFLGYFVTVVMTFTSIPAMCGYDIYPMASFVFIPVGILTYGILRYKLMEISSVLHMSMFWFILSSIIVLPNMALFITLKEYFYSISLLRLSLLFVIWFFINFLYFIRIQPFIDRLFNRLKYDLRNIETGFSRDLSQLKSLDELAHELSSVLKMSLNVKNARLFCRDKHLNIYSDQNGCSLELSLDLLIAIGQHDYLEKSLIQSAQDYNHVELSLLKIFDTTESEYLIPMNHRNEVIAFLCISQKKDLKRLNDSEFRFMTRISSYASIAVANSVIFQDISDIKNNLEEIVTERTSVIERQKIEMEKDIELARKIQTALLPNHIPHIPQVDIAYRYEPIMKVGGDFIDVHYREGMNQLGLFICDVSGHGAASAMIASMVKMSLNSWGKFINSPGQAFIEMRNMLYGKIGENFITACMCCIDLNTGEVISANAGHPPMIIARADGNIEVINSRGRIIVDYAPSDYEEHHCMLNKGDKLLLYTDGVIEARNTHWDYGENRFHDIIRKNISLSVNELCMKIYKGIAIDDDVTSIEDDFAILAIEYRG